MAQRMTPNDPSYWMLSNNSTSDPISERSMTPDQEYEHYAREENQHPQGDARRRGERHITGE